MYQAKQQCGDLIATKDWTNQLPPGHSVELRIDSKTEKPRVLGDGRTVYRTDLQWRLGGGFVLEAFGSALKLMGPEGEVRNVFRRVSI